MAKIAVIALTLFLIVINNGAIAREKYIDNKYSCEKTHGVWREFGNKCANFCSYKTTETICSPNLVISCDCGKRGCFDEEENKCWNVEEYKNKIKTDSEKKLAEEKRIEEEEKAEKLKIEEDKKAAEKKAIDDKIAADKKIADDKKIEDQKKNDDKKIDDKKIEESRKKLEEAMKLESSQNNLEENKKVEELKKSEDSAKTEKSPLKLIDSILPATQNNKK